MHVRIQGWIPYEIQVYSTDHVAGPPTRPTRIGCVRYDNSLLTIDALDIAAELCERFAHRAWPPVLNALARLLNPICCQRSEPLFRRFSSVIDQAEIATDVMFHTGPSCAIWPDLVRATPRSNLSSEDVLRLLGSQAAPVAGRPRWSTDAKRRPEGWRIRHRMAGNRSSSNSVATASSPVLRSRLYRVTSRDASMTAANAIHDDDYPVHYLTAADNVGSVSHDAQKPRIEFYRRLQALGYRRRHRR